MPHIKQKYPMENIRDVDKMKQDFFWVPIDEASNNIICKRLYLSVLKILNSGNFEEVNRPSNTILNNCEKYMYDHSIPFDMTCSKWPFMYWTRKLHKTPYGSSFIEVTFLEGFNPLITSIKALPEIP